MNPFSTKRNSGIAAGIAALMTIAVMAGSAAPASASGLTQLLGMDSGSKRESRQGDKNNMRNLGIGLGAAAAISALKGKGTQALVLGAGAAYSGKKYEDARKAQSKEDNRDNRWYRYNRNDRSDRNDRYDNRGGNDRRDSSSDRYSRR